MTETTFIILKTDTIRRALTGQVITRLENTGLKITAMKLIQATQEKAKEHYKEHEGRNFYGPLVDLLCSGPILLVALEGAHAVDLVRKIVGSTEPAQSAPGTIRGDYTHISYERAAKRMGVISNLIHASDSLESAGRELALWFEEGDFVTDYHRCDEMYF